MKLQTSVGGVHFDTPLLLASGFITETPDFYLRSRKHGCAGMITRSLKEVVPPERAQVPAPRYVVLDGGDTMLNAEWGNEHPWEHWRDDWIAQAKDNNGRLILSLSGRDVEGCGSLIKQFDPLGPDAFEINVSCSHSGQLHGNLNVDHDHMARLLGHVRSLTERPIWIKLSYSTILMSMAQQAQDLGADAIVCTNTIGPGLVLDIETGQPKLGIKGGAGGVSGKSIFPIALWCVYELSKALDIPVIGVGGINTASDVIQMLMAGASAVQLYTAPALKGPHVFREIERDLEAYLEKHSGRYQHVGDLVGVAHGFRKEHSFSAPPPLIVEERCTGCIECFASCAFDAISFVPRVDGPVLAVIGDTCNGCNACVGVCPPEFNAILEQ